MSHSFAAIKPKPLKLPKITYFVVFGNKTYNGSMSLLENINKQKTAGRLFLNMVYGVEAIGLSAKEKNDKVELIREEYIMSLHHVQFGIYYLCAKLAGDHLL